MRRLVSRCSLTAALLAGALAVCVVRPVAAQSGENVLLVVNELSETSVRVGAYYALKRNLPANHVVRIKTVVGDALSRNEYLATIEAPIANWLGRHQLQDQILYIVLTKDVPLRVLGTGGADGSMAAVDSELTLLYRKLSGADVRVLGRVNNPYYLADRPLSQARPFTRTAFDIYLVTRLDGFTFADVVALIDRGLAPSRDGRIVLDQREPADAAPGGDRWLVQAADRLATIAAGDRVLLESTAAAAATTDPVLAYASWGSNDAVLRQRRLGLRFANGALASLFISSDGRTFAEPPEEWTPGSTRERVGIFAGSDQTLAGDLLREGVTGMAAQVAEPLLDAMVRPQILFPVYLSGLNLAESFYAAMPFLGWQTVVIGDPLCAPFRTQALPSSEIARPVNADTETPGLLAERRMNELGRTGLKTDALKIKLKIESRQLRGASDADVEPLMIEATRLEPRLVDLQMRLGMLLQARGDTAAAIARYRQVLAVQSQHPVALNNLAVALAETPDTLTEALSLAERAYQMTGSATMGETLGWIYHRLGRHGTAAPLIERALASDSQNIEFLLHAAAVHAALNDKVRAQLELDTALRLDPTLASRPDVRTLIGKIRP